MITIINLQLPQMITIITLLCSRKTTMASTSTPLLSQTQDIASLVIGCGYHNNHPDDDDDDDDDDDCVAHLRQTPRTAGTSSSSSSHSKTAVKNSVPETWRMLIMAMMAMTMTKTWTISQKTRRPYWQPTMIFPSWIVAQSTSSS